MQISETRHALLARLAWELRLVLVGSILVVPGQGEAVLWVLGRGGRRVVAMRTQAGVQFLAADPHGSAEEQIDGSTQTLTQRRFDPFGRPRGAPAGVWTGEKGFVGGTMDPDGLTQLGARAYDPDTGRFISVDPVFDLQDPQSWNGYTYADNNPATSSDPSGEWTDGCLRGCTSSSSSNKTSSSKDDGGWTTPVSKRLGLDIVLAPNQYYYYLAYIRAGEIWNKKHPAFHPEDGPYGAPSIPQCDMGAKGGIARGACGPGDIFKLTEFAHLVCKIGGFTCRSPGSFGKEIGLIAQAAGAGGIGFGKDGNGLGAAEKAKPEDVPAAKGDKADQSGSPLPGVGDVPRKVVNSNMGHIDETRAARAGFEDVPSAQAAIQNLGRSIEKGGFPEGTVPDTARSDRVLVPVGDKGYAVYQIKKNGNATFKTILTAR